MTEGPGWQPIFDQVSQIPGTETSPKRLTEKDIADKWAFLNRRNAAGIAVSMGAVDTGDDFDPYSALSDIAEDLDDRLEALEDAEVDVAALTHAADAKTTPVDADELPIVDSEAANVLKRLSWSNLKAAIGTWYDSATRTLTNKTLGTTVLAGGSGTATVQAGTGSPEGVKTATPGSMYTDTDGGAGSTLWIKESGTGNTGWVAK